ETGCHLLRTVPECGLARAATRDSRTRSARTRFAVVRRRGSGLQSVLDRRIGDDCATGEAGVSAESADRRATLDWRGESPFVPRTSVWRAQRRKPRGAGPRCGTRRTVCGAKYPAAYAARLAKPS